MPLSPDRCPGVLHALSCRDGMLLRVRVPGGLLSSAQWVTLARIADNYGDAHVDITTRANVQLRGIPEALLPQAVEELTTSGLLPSAAHDRVRNIFAGPFAGIDPTELIDVRPLVRDLDNRLREDAALSDLPAKFGFAFDGGGRFPPRLTGTHLALQAANTTAGVIFRLAIDGTPTAHGVKPEDAVTALLQAARLYLREQFSFHKPACEGTTSSPHTLATAPSPLGVHPGASALLATIVPSVPFGRMSAERIKHLIAAMREFDGEMRLAPWRGIVLASIPISRKTTLIKVLTNLGLTLDGSDGYAHITACSGIQGCTEALADVRADAHVLAHRRARRSGGGRAIPIALAGCAKRCGMRETAVALVATMPGYDLHVGKARISSHTGPEDAFAAISHYV